MADKFYDTFTSLGPMSPALANTLSAEFETRKIYRDDFRWLADSYRAASSELDRLRSHVSRLEAERDGAVRDYEKGQAKWEATLRALAGTIERADAEQRRAEAHLAAYHQEHAVAEGLKAHAARLEESLRVALEARAEAVKVLNEVAPALDYCIEELEAFGWLDKDEHVRAARGSLARAIGGAK